MKNQSYTCPNPSCGKVFTAPIKVENLNARHAGIYDACPYCLTEIAVEEKAAITETNPKPQVEVDVKVQEVNVQKGKETLQVPKKQECPHHFGYLSQRKTKEKIPEECMMCENIVQCMLKNVTG